MNSSGAKDFVILDALSTPQRFVSIERKDVWARARTVSGCAMVVSGRLQPMRSPRQAQGPQEQ